MITIAKKRDTYKRITFLALCLANTTFCNSGFASNPQQEALEDKGAIYRSPSNTSSQDEKLAVKRKFSEFQQTALTRCSDSKTPKKQRTQYLTGELFPPARLPFSGKITAGASIFAREIPYVGTLQAHISNVSKIEEIGELLLSMSEENEALQKAFMRGDEENAQLRSKVQKHRTLFCNVVHGLTDADEDLSDEGSSYESDSSSWDGESASHEEKEQI